MLNGKINSESVSVKISRLTQTVWILTQKLGNSTRRRKQVNIIR